MALYRIGFIMMPGLGQERVKCLLSTACHCYGVKTATDKPLFLNRVKITLSTEQIVIKMVDRDTQKLTIESWAWEELV